MPDKSVLIISYAKSNKSKSVNQLLKTFMQNGVVATSIPISNWTSEDSNMIDTYKQHYSIIMNWGGKMKELPNMGILNNSAGYVSDKKNFFSHCINYSDIAKYVPKFTPHRHIAVEWIASGYSVVAREFTNKSGGLGISIHDTSAFILPKVPLYTMYYKKSAEYRVHFFKNTDSDIQLFVQKKKKLKEFNTQDIDEYNIYKIRNLAHGWVYSSINFEPPSHLYKVAKEFAKILPLTYGALDIIYSGFQDTLKVLEVNTAPGLCESTANWYCSNIENLFSS